MRAYFCYLYSSLSGRSLRFVYSPAEVKWSRALSTFQEYFRKFNADGDLLISVSDTEISLQEFYDSGVRYRGSAMVINNEILVSIEDEGGNAKMTFYIWRALESRLITNVATVIAFLSSLILMYDISKWIGRDEIPQLLPLLMLILICHLVTITMWMSTRMKYLGVKRRVLNIIQS